MHRFCTGLLLAVALAGCSGPASTPAAGSGGDPASSSTSFEPITFRGTARRAWDCLERDGTRLPGPVTPGPLHALPENAAGRLYRLETTGPAGLPDVGRECLLFDDGTLFPDSRGTIPEGVPSVHVVATAGAEITYELRIE